VLNIKELKEVLESGNGEIHKSLHKDLTARTYAIDSNQLIIEFYDGQGILIATQKDYENLKRVR